MPYSECSKTPKIYAHNLSSVHFFSFQTEMDASLGFNIGTQCCFCFGHQLFSRGQSQCQLFGPGLQSDSDDNHSLVFIFPQLQHFFCFVPKAQNVRTSDFYLLSGDRTLRGVFLLFFQGVVVCSCIQSRQRFY